MEIEIRFWKSVIRVLILALTIYYTIFIFTTPIDYNWPKHIKFRDYQSMIDDFGNECVRMFCYKIPFKVETRQILDIRALRKNENIFSIDSKTYVETEDNININIDSFLEKSKLVDLPEIFLNRESIELKARGNFYSLGSLSFLKDKTNLFEIRNLVLRRDIYNISEIRVPLFFNKNNYVESINIPQIFPFFVTRGDQTRAIVYSVEVPKFYRIDKKTSGFQKVSFPHISTGISYEVKNGISIMTEVNAGSLEPIRTGTINQNIDDKSNKNVVTFSTFISINNPFYSFEVSFLPSTQFLFLIILLLLVPLIIEIGRKLSIVKATNKDFITKSYLLMISFIGSLSVINIEDLMLFFGNTLFFINPFFLIFLILLPIIYVGISEKYLKNSRIIKIKKLKIRLK